MKTLYALASLLLFSFSSFGQISFEEINPPADCSINFLIKSPTGEYFLQGYEDFNYIYTSNDGISWEEFLLPFEHQIEEIQFYQDGTPVLTHGEYDNIIRQNGVWRPIPVGGGQGNYNSTFVQNDTLFAFRNNILSFSTNKGISMQQLFTTNGTYPDFETYLWKYENNFILYNSASLNIDIYNNEGIKTYTKQVSTSLTDFCFNECGRILFYNPNSYETLDIPSLNFLSGNMNADFPFSNLSFFNRSIISNNGNYYAKKDDIIYKSDGCNLTWSVFSQSQNILNHQFFWITSDEDVLVCIEEYGRGSCGFFEFNSQIGEWNRQTISISNPYVIFTGESFEGDQFVLTENNIFTKRYSDQEWEILNTTVDFFTRVDYSPSGDLYISQGDHLLYSEDNGLTFSTIDYPDTLDFRFVMLIDIVDDGVIVAIDPTSLNFNGAVSRDNGRTWTMFRLPLIINEDPFFKLIGDFVYIYINGNVQTTFKVNIYTGEVLEHAVGGLNRVFSLSKPTILDDGTGYFLGSDVLPGTPVGLFKYDFGSVKEFVASIPYPPFKSFLYSANNQIYVFQPEEYGVLNEDQFEFAQYIGLPSTDNVYFILTEHNYVYVIVENSRIFRSSEPISYKYKVSGNLVYDLDEDCLDNPADQGLRYWQVKIENSDYLSIKSTVSDGEFTLLVPEGNYTLSAQPINSHWELCTNSFQISVNPTQPETEQDFRVNAKDNCAELKLDFSAPLLRRCFQNDYTVYVHNSGPAEATATKLTFKLDPFFNFISATIPYTQIDASTLEFDLGTLALGEEVTFKLRVEVSCDADLGMEHCLEGSLTADNICGNTNPESVDYIECQENIGSYDPNDKRIFNKNGKEVSQVDLDEYIYYHIRFQNTGNDTAFTVRILDTLAEELDINTFEMLSASHAYEYNISKGPVLEVLFNDILLVDSFKNEPESHGYFKFKIKPKEGFGYGTMIPNEAAIYFDFNNPVITNEAVLTIMKPSSIRDQAEMIDFEVYPNPVRDELRIAISDMDLSKVDEMEIVNQIGEVVLRSNFELNSNIKTSNLTSGIYLIVLKEKGGIVGSRKFVKQ
jgi:uncharacterized repeat protein (TIGR01451 family)